MTQPLANMPDQAPPGGLKTVEIDKRFRAPFYDFKKICFWANVEKITSHQKKQDRVLVFCVSLMFLTDLDATIYRVARFEDVEKVVCQDQGQGKSLIAIKFYESVNEPTLLILLQPDSRNPPECQTKDQLLHVLRTLRQPSTRQPLAVEDFPPGQNLHGAAGLGPWSKPPGYLSPLLKMRQYAYGQATGASSGAAETPHTGGAQPGLPFPKGALVQLMQGERGTVTGFQPPDSVQVELGGGQGTRVLPISQVRRVMPDEMVVTIPMAGGELGANVQNNAGARPLIMEVDEGGAAARAGLPVGWLILAVDGQPTHTGEEAIAAVVRARARGAPSVDFTIGPGEADDAVDPFGFPGATPRGGGPELLRFPGEEDFFEEGEEEEEESFGGQVEGPAVGGFGFEVLDQWDEEQSMDFKEVKDELIQTRLAIKRAHEEIMMLRYERDTFISQRYTEQRRNQEHQEIRRGRERRKRSPSNLLARELGRLWVKNCHRPEKNERRRDEKATRRRLYDPLASSYGGRDPIAGVLRGYRGARGTYPSQLL